jgi:dynamin 1-like protein
MSALLNRYKSPTKEMITNLVNIEMSFINTNHPDFVGGDGAITAILERMSKLQAAANAQQNVI